MALSLARTLWYRHEHSPAVELLPLSHYAKSFFFFWYEKGGCFLMNKELEAGAEAEGDQEQDREVVERAK